MSAAIAVRYPVPTVPGDLGRLPLSRLWDLQQANVDYCCQGEVPASPDDCDGCPALMSAQEAYDVIQAAIEQHPSWRRYLRRWGMGG